jgi:hypothetical protein
MKKTPEQQRRWNRKTWGNQRRWAVSGLRGTGLGPEKELLNELFGPDAPRYPKPIRLRSRLKPGDKPLTLPRK